MKASEVIAELAEQISEKGDLEVKFEDHTGYRYEIDAVWSEKTPEQSKEVICLS